MQTVCIVCINLISRVERRRRILNWFKQLKKNYDNVYDLHLSLLEACDGVSQSLAQLNVRYGVRPYPYWALSSSAEGWQNNFPTSWRHPQTSGGIASTLSHLDAISLAGSFFAEFSDPVVVVVEDDIDFSTGNFLDRALALVAEAAQVAPQWDMLLFGASDARADISDSQTVSSNIQRAGFTYMTTAYAVSRKCTEKFRNLHAAILENCLVFDELHNALAGYTEKVRPELVGLYGDERINLFAISSNICRQAPEDCGHDTTLNAGSRTKSEISYQTSTQSREEVFRHEFFLADHGRVVWWRRSPGIPVHRLAYEAVKKPEELRRQRLSLGGILRELSTNR